MPNFSIRPADDLAVEGLADLVERAEAESIGIVAAVITSWRDGTQHYDLPGEALLAAPAGSSPWQTNLDGASAPARLRDNLRTRHATPHGSSRGRSLVTTASVVEM